MKETSIKKNKIVYKIDGKTISIKPIKFNGKLSIEEYEKQILKSLNKIGICEKNVYFKYGDEKISSFAQIIWEIENKKYHFKCDIFHSNKDNIGSLALAIQEDVRQITRGIKNIWQIMKQYEKYEIKEKKKKDLLYFNTIKKEEKKSNNTQNAIDKLFPIDKNKIESIESPILDKKYYYLLKYDNNKLDILYFKLKEECIKQNTPNHPLFNALKIVRKKKGLKL